MAILDLQALQAPSYDSEAAGKPSGASKQVILCSVLCRC